MLLHKLFADPSFEIQKKNLQTPKVYHCIYLDIPAIKGRSNGIPIDKEMELTICRLYTETI